MTSDQEWSVPSMVDGLTRCQRKILYTALTSNLAEQVIDVAQLALHVYLHTLYPHSNLVTTIVRMAQDFVGSSNNINLLLPNGNFGNRYAGGKHHGKANGICTQLSPITRYLFPKDDDILLDYYYLSEDDQVKVIEPTLYMPVIPTVLVNGSHGAGKGRRASIPIYNPRDIIANIRRLLNGDPPEPMCPWYKGFKGTIKKISATKDGRVTYAVTGVIDKINDTTLRITELPLGRWIGDYYNFLRSRVIGNAKAEDPFIEDFSEVNDGELEVVLSEENMAIAEQEGLLEKFQLTTTICTRKMRLLDSNGVIAKYDNPEEVLEDFYRTRLAFYEKRKRVIGAYLETELLKLENKVKYADAWKEGKFINLFYSRAERAAEFYGMGFDPVREETNAEKYEEMKKFEGDDSVISVIPGSKGVLVSDYMYLLEMPPLCKESFTAIPARRDQMIVKVEEMKKSSAKCLWRKDLDALERAMDERDRPGAAKTDFMLLFRPPRGTALTFHEVAMPKYGLIANNMNSCNRVLAMETEGSDRKEGKSLATPVALKEISGDDEDEDKKKKGGRKPPPPPATKKRGAAAEKQTTQVGEEPITEVMKPAGKAVGVSPEKKKKRKNEPELKRIKFRASQ